MVTVFDRSVDWGSDPRNVGRFRVYQAFGYWVVRPHGSYDHKAFRTFSDAMNSVYGGAA